jgi:probable phosphomutase (TIGR03848 family)
MQLLLIRHAQNDYNRTGRLAGRLAGVHLNEEGIRQARALGERLASVNLQALYSSPLERAVETALEIARHHPALELQIEEGISEVDVGKWAGQRLRQLARSRLWSIVQGYPSGAYFPAGEGIREMQARAVAVVERIALQHPYGRVAIVSHADVIKAIVAHYAGIHLDLFQRLTVAPASISIIHLHRRGPSIQCLNDISHYEGQSREGR